MAMMSEARELPSSRYVHYGMWLGSLLLAVSCKPAKTETAPVERPAAVAQAPVVTEPLLLEINGYNYTDLYVDSFEVDGQGGGDLEVSSTTTGGGKGVCCMGFRPGTKLPVELTIKWTRDRKRWCEKTTVLQGPVPANPRHLGVHFFPDGHIEAEITEDYPDLKLKLERTSAGERKSSGNMVQDERTARCRDGYDP